MKKRSLMFTLATAMIALSSACGSDTETAEQTTTTGEKATTTTAVAPTYEFAVQASSEEYMPSGNTVYTGQKVKLDFIELDPEGNPCPTDPEVTVTDASGDVVTTARGATVTLPDEVTEGPLTFTVRCVRKGEPGQGTWEPVAFAERRDLSVSPSPVAPGGTVTVQVAGGCPEGSEGKTGLWNIGQQTPLSADGTGQIDIPGPPPPPEGQFTAIAECTDGKTVVAVAFAPVPVSTS
jgi:hypothetical protein